MTRRPNRWLLLAGMAALSLAAVVTFAALSSLAPEQARSAAPASPADPSVRRGQDLFVAKGCVTCHVHGALANDSGLPAIRSLQVGPNLTTYTADPSYIREWLRDPAAIRPRTEMPKLELSPDEIDALVAFLNSTSGK